MRGGRAALLAALFGALLFALHLPAQAVETSSSEFVVIPEGDVLAEDLYAGSIKVTVAGEIDGDLIAFAAEEVVIDGTVTGSVMAVSPLVTVNGSVGQSLRVTGNSLRVQGSVGGDVVAAVLDLDLEEESRVNGDVLTWSWSARSVGLIGGDLEGTQRSLELAGEVEGDVDVTVGQLQVIDSLSVGGDLGYRSDSEATGLDSADVGGVIVEKEPLPPNIRVRALGLFGRFLVVLFLAIAALATAWSWPERTRSAVQDMAGSPWRAWSYGALVMFSPLILIGMAALLLGLAPPAASLPLLAIMAPVALAAVGLVGAIALVAGTPVVAWLGNALFRGLDLYAAIVVGSAIAGVVWFLPFVGWLVPVIGLPLGLGGWLLGFGGDEDVATAA